jgi:hypothetical protein
VTVDIRAITICSLGTVIQGSIADEAISPGQGLVRCRGQLILDGLQTPASGTVVELAYVRDGRVVRIPRKLRVISSFADPFRDQTTVQIGDKLVWLADKAPNPALRKTSPRFPANPEPGDIFNEELPYPDPASDDPDTPLVKQYEYNGLCWQPFYEENNNFDLAKEDLTAAEQTPTRPFDEELRAPTTTAAYTIAAKCLAGLSIAGSGILLLTSQYKANEITITRFVDTLEQLLSSESLIGYLDANEVLRVKQLALLSGGSGPQIDEDVLIDVGPIGTGTIPVDEEIEIDETPTKDDPEEDPDPEPIQAFPITARTTTGGYGFSSSSILQYVRYDYYRATVGQVKVTVKEETANNLSLIKTGDSYFAVVNPGTGAGSVSYEVTDGNTTASSVITVVFIEAAKDDPPTALTEPFGLVAQTPPGVAGGSEWSKTTGKPVVTTVPFTGAVSGEPASARYVGIPSSFYEEVYGKYDEVLYRREVSTINAASVCPNVYKLYLEAATSLADFPSDFDVSVVRFTRFVYDYSFENSFYADPEAGVFDESNQPQSKTCSIGKACQSGIEVPENPNGGDTFKFGECTYVFDGFNWQPSEEDGEGELTEQEVPPPSNADLVASLRPVLVRQITSVYESYCHAVGAIDWPDNLDYLPPLFAGEILVERTNQYFKRYVTDANKSTERWVSRTDTYVERARYKTVEGQQFLASLGDLNVSSISSLAVVGYAVYNVPADNETVLRGERNYGLQQRNELPEKNEQNKEGGDAEGSTDESLAGGFIPTKPRSSSEGLNQPIPPYRPAMPRTWDPENGYQELRDGWAELNDKVLKLRYQRAYRQIAYGNRYGMSLQMGPWELPMYPLSPLYLNLRSVVGAYASNGLSIAFNAEGIIANVDALLIGGVGGTGTPYFPVANSIALPPAPSPVVNEDYVLPNSIEIPEGFDPNSPGSIWSSLPATDAESFEQSLTPDYVYPSIPTTIKAVLGVRVGMAFRRYDYSLDGGVFPQALGIVTGITARRQLGVRVPATVAELLALNPTVSTGAAVRPAVAAVTVAAVVPRVASSYAAQVPAASITVAAAPGPIVPREALRLFAPVAGIAIGAVPPVLSTGVGVAVPAAVVAVNGVVPRTGGNLGDNYGLTALFEDDLLALL